MLIRNATIYTAVQREPVQGDILIRNGKIAAVGPNLDAAGEAPSFFARFCEQHGDGTREN